MAEAAIKRPQTNLEIAQCLDDVADRLEILGENPFRVRAYRNASRVIGDLSQPVEILLQDPKHPLTELPGIGRDLAEKITTIAQTGDLPLRRELEKKLPKGLRELLTIPALGPKRALMLYQKLNIHGKAELLKAARAHRIQRLKGFGEVSERNILRGIESLEAASHRFLLSEARVVARSIESHLREEKGITDFLAAGSLRRGKETVGDLDLLVSCEKPKAIMDRLQHYESKPLLLGRGRTKLSVRLKNGLQVDLRIVPKASFGAAAVYFTGSKAHNIELRRRALQRKLKINEYGVFRGAKRIAGKTEEEIYRSIGLAWIPPELREARGEITLAEKGNLPKLITQKDLRGDLHSHTRETDGRATLFEMAEAAQERGYSYLAITDHSKRVTMAHGMDAARVKKQWKEIDKLNAKLRGLTLLKGIELDILADGSLDLPDSLLAEADWVVASIHYNQKQPKRAMTARILRAVQSPYVSAIGHPNGRLIGRREAIDFDHDVIFRAATDHGCALEINSQPTRLDLPDLQIARAKELGVSFVIDSDAHSTEGLGAVELGVLQARRGGVESRSVWNTLPLEKLLKAAKRR